MTEKLGFGCASLSSMKSSGSVNRLLHTAYNLGIFHFDTAPLYGQGFSETLVGSFIKNKRDKITVTTKFGLGNYPISKIPPSIALPLNYYRKKLKGQLSKPQLQQPKTENEIEGDEIISYTLPVKRVSKAEIEISLLSSLKRLNTEYIDYYLLHENLPLNIDESALEYLLNMKQKGIILGLGIGSNIQMIESLGNELSNSWQVLQYEYIPDQFNKLLEKHSDKIHIVHSTLKHCKNIHINDVPPENRAGYLLAECARKNILGKVLFSTRNISRLEKNLSSFHKYY